MGIFTCTCTCSNVCPTFDSEDNGSLSSPGGRGMCGSLTVPGGGGGGAALPCVLCLKHVVM